MSVRNFLFREQGLEHTGTRVAPTAISWPGTCAGVNVGGGGSHSVPDLSSVSFLHFQSGATLEGEALLKQLQEWADHGTIEPVCCLPRFVSAAYHDTLFCGYIPKLPCGRWKGPKLVQDSYERKAMSKASIVALLL